MSTEHMAQVQIFDDEIYVTLLFCTLSRSNGQTLVISNRIEKCNYDKETMKNILRQPELKNKVLTPRRETQKYEKIGDYRIAIKVLEMYETLFGADPVIHI